MTFLLPPRISFIFLTISIFSFFTFSCENDIDKITPAETEKTDAANSQELETRSSNTTLGVINENGILKFRDYDHFQSVLESLIDAQENHLLSFENTYPNLSNQELDEKEEEIGFVYFKPLINYEQSLNFSSQRAKIEAEIVSWLDNEELDMSKSPKRKSRHSVEFNSLINENGQVKIGSQIIDIAPNKLIDIASNKIGEDCWAFEKQKYDEEYVTDKKYEALLEYDSWPFVMKAHAEITHFKRKNNGGWKRSRANLKINVSGKTYDENCGAQTPFKYWKDDSKKRKSLDVRVHIFSGRVLKAKDNEVISNYEVNGHVGSLVLAKD